MIDAEQKPKYNYPDYFKDIKIIRQKLGLTQKEFADKLNISFCTVNRWENSKTKPLPAIQDRINELVSGSNPKTERDGE